MFLILITSQIVNLKMIRATFVFIKCYQCGGETLAPVVKHCVSSDGHGYGDLWQVMGTGQYRMGTGANIFSCDLPISVWAGDRCVTESHQHRRDTSMLTTSSHTLNRDKAHLHWVCVSSFRCIEMSSPHPSHTFSRGGKPSPSSLFQCYYMDTKMGVGRCQRGWGMGRRAHPLNQ